MGKRALLSLYDKEGLVEFGRGLVELGWELVSTGGTARKLREAGVLALDVSQVTGFPEIMDGRVKTLHPAILGGILGRRDEQRHLDEMARLGIRAIDLVATNLYPFQATATKPGVAFEEVIENIDIGGPSMIRAAAKNFRHVLVVTDPQDYQAVLVALREGRDDEGFRLRLASAAFAHTAAYDAVISAWFEANLGRGPADLPARLVLAFDRAEQLSYGENPHQKAALYREPFARAGALSASRQLSGKPLSFNNLNDAQGAVEAVRGFDRPAAVAVKHATPCGVGVGETLAEACSKAQAADPVSIYGGIVALNRPLDEAAAEVLRGVHLDVLVAPGYAPAALEALARKTALRVLECADLAVPRGPAPGGAAPGGRAAGYDLKRIGGGVLVQTLDDAPDDPRGWRVVTKRRPTPAELEQLALAWEVVRHVRSNAIVLARDGMTVGIGGGQTNRVEAARIAARQAGERAKGAVMASDAYIPFPDTVEVAIEAGVTAIAQPGGSMRDREAVDAADRAGLAMVFTGTRHLRH